jgi:hypothetical protein
VKACGSAIGAPRYERFLAEDFSLLIRAARIRIVRGRPVVLS